MFEIEKNVEQPKIKRTRYPWRKLEVGESFFVPNRIPAQVHTTRAAERVGGKFSARTENNGVRITRTA